MKTRDDPGGRSKRSNLTVMRFLVLLTPVVFLHRTMRGWRGMEREYVNVVARKLPMQQIRHNNGTDQSGPNTRILNIFISSFKSYQLKIYRIRYSRNIVPLFEL
jgi:hypothetical protein